MFLWQSLLNYLSHDVDSEGLHTTLEKLKAILDACTPKDLNQMRSFLGLVTMRHKKLSYGVAKKFILFISKKIMLWYLNLIAVTYPGWGPPSKPAMNNLNIIGNKKNYCKVKMAVILNTTAAVPANKRQSSIMIICSIMCMI